MRHGQSTWNVVDRMQGQELGPPLTDLGRTQAAAAAEELATLHITRVLSSPAVRAQQTAEIIADRLGLTVETEDLLLEKGLDESLPAVLTRVRILLDLDLPASTVMVSHGDTIGLAVGLLSASTPTLAANASITSVDRDGTVTVIDPGS
ncbi:histidine phosphatase family protein [Aeromicrobium sp. CF3.5]|uniref:histidine phosphatase family protein n=1 Tax=Aeromicrobium sp. CF3.5 TaxID=3373078 RepID=UPI003EE57E50